MLSNAEEPLRSARQASRATAKDNSWYWGSSDGEEESDQIRKLESKLESLQDEYSTQSWNRRLFFPPEGYHKWQNLAHQRIVSGGSHLKYELRPEDIPDVDSADLKRSWNWSSESLYREGQELVTAIEQAFDGMFVELEDPEESDGSASAFTPEEAANEDVRKPASSAHAFVARSLAARPPPYRFRKPRYRLQSKTDRRG